MHAAETLYKTPYGEFNLVRYPARSRETLQAWCAADSLLLEEMHRLEVPANELLLVNDAHGALTVALRPQALWTDSALAVLALRQNESRNQQGPARVIWSTATPPPGATLAAVRIPKNLPYFEYQLRQLAKQLPAGATVLAAGMDKHLSPHTADILERFIGPTQRQRGRHKARLFSAVKEPRAAITEGDSGTYYCEALAAKLYSLPNVFSRDTVDIGTRFLLTQLHKLAPVRTIIDLACGNGVLGLRAYQQKIAEKLTFCDESAMAIASAQHNVTQLFPGQLDDFAFHQGDGLLGYQGEPAELILCNPPFHLEHTVDDFAGRRLLQQCSASLSAGGALCLVANRHLDYLPLLQREFHTVEKLAGNAKFNIFLARKA